MPAFTGRYVAKLSVDESEAQSSRSNAVDSLSILYENP